MKRIAVIVVACFVVVYVGVLSSCPVVSNWNVSPKIQIVKKRVAISCTVTPKENQKILNWKMIEVMTETKAERDIATYTVNSTIAIIADGSTEFEVPGIRKIKITGDWEDLVDPSGFSGDTSSSELSIVKIDIKQGANIITNTTHDEIVGKKISLSTDVSPASVSITKKQWTIPGIRVTNFAGSDVSGVVTGLTILTNSNIDYYWVDGGTGRDVEYAITVDGNELKGKATFNVKIPTATIEKVTQAITVDTNNYFEIPGTFLHLGGAKPKKLPGVQFQATTTVPTGYTGEFQWVQIIQALARRKGSNGKWEKLAENGLDESYPYLTGVYYQDSPGVLLEDIYSEYTNNDSMQSYFMFKPSGPNSIFIPIKLVTWGWSGTATKSSSTWSLSASSISGPTETSTTTFPTWTSKAEGTWVEE